MSEKRCYTIGDIQEILGICRKTAYNLIRENRFRSILVGGKYMISKRSFDAWLDGELKECNQEQAEERGGVEREERDVNQERDFPVLINFGHHAR